MTEELGEGLFLCQSNASNKGGAAAAAAADGLVSMGHAVGRRGSGKAGRRKGREYMQPAKTAKTPRMTSRGRREEARRASNNSLRRRSRNCAVAEGEEKRDARTTKN